MSNTYQPESLHPYIMNDRLKKATGSGGISNIPIASADTIGGIMIGGSANPITITGSGNASIRKATAELLGVVKAGAGVSVDEDGAISGVAYSTTEHKTGRKWIDGKDIYEMTISLDSKVWIETSGSNIVTAPANIDQLLGSSGAIHRDNTSNMNVPIITSIGNGYLKGQGFIRTELKMITIWYTKTV